ncbi:MAG: hypothetical protein JXB20_01590 [Bacilli bacterium]|nr:hypothetical protein [Bacilli bacterium]MBN2696366.1 hypothetical protein [Bacilli bacterium]
MEKLIKDIVELDKVYRTEVNALREEKEKISEFVREEKKRLKRQYEKVAKDKILKLQADIAADLEKRKQEAISESEKTLTNLESSYKKNKDVWVNNIYEYCLEK